MVEKLTFLGKSKAPKQSKPVQSKTRDCECCGLPIEGYRVFTNICGKCFAYLNSEE